MSVTFVCGPPGSGKSSYVREHAVPGDLIVDLDAIASALSGQPWYDQPEGIVGFALSCQNAVISALVMGAPVRHAWIIVRGALRYERRQFQRLLGAEVVVLAVPARACLQRIWADQERHVVPLGEWERRVNGWWAAYEPDTKGNEHE